MKRSLILATFAIALLTPALAHAFDPDTQSHPGACSETTVDVHRAVGDLSANGVLSDYAEEMGIEREGGSLTVAAEAQLVVVRLAHGTVADNHGCEEGIVFPVGPRHLHKGEQVAIRVPASLKGRLCSGPGPDCVAKRVTRHRALPINCWNLDEGDIAAVVYVHKPPPPPAPKPAPIKVAMPSVTAQVSCEAGAVLVELGNDPKATADASFLVNGKHQGPVAPGHELTAKVPVADGQSVKVTVQSDGKTLIEHVYTSHCGAPVTPTATPTAAATVTPAPPRVLPAVAMTLTCNAEEFRGTVILTLYNAAAATLPAYFEVTLNEVISNYGPVEPGQLVTTTVGEVAEGEDVFLEVKSGGSLILTEEVFNPCEEGG